MRKRKREYDKQYSHESYEWYKAHRVCVDCHRQDAINGQVRCPECAGKARERTRDYQVDPVKRREYMREYMRAYRKAGRDVREFYEID